MIITLKKIAAKASQTFPHPSMRFKTPIEMCLAMILATEILGTLTSLAFSDMQLKLNAIGSLNADETLIKEQEDVGSYQFRPGKAPTRRMSRRFGSKKQL